MNISVVGGGRMGLPLACMFGLKGGSVVVCDINPALVAAINAGQCPYEEPGLPELIAQLHRQQRLRATVDTALAARTADVVVIIVPAHLTPDRHIDLSVLKAASRAVGQGSARAHWSSTRRR